MLFLIENSPPCLNIILSSRSDPPWPLARLRAGGDMIELRTRDLRFSAEEAAAFLNRAMQLELRAGDVAALTERTEGWIAGLQMAAISLQSRLRVDVDGDLSGFVADFAGSHRFVLDYLVEEVLNQQDPDVQQFLLLTSILNRMTALLCNALTGRSDSQAILELLDQSNLFTIPLDDERRWYRYHHLFADLLRSRLKATSPEISATLHRAASVWYQDAGSLEEAIQHALAGEDHGHAAELIDRHARDMMAHSNVPTLARWLEALPPAVLRLHPWLCAYHAWAQYWTGKREGVEECLQMVEQTLADVSVVEERRHLAGYVSAIRAFCAITAEDISGAGAEARKALELLPARDYMRGLAGIVLAGAQAQKGETSLAERSYAEASHAARVGGYPLVAAAAACYQGGLQATRGNLKEARETFRDALDWTMSADGRRLPAAGFPLVKLGELWREWNDLPSARRHLIEGVELCIRWGHPDILGEAYTFLARYYVSAGEPARVQETLDRADHLTRRVQVDPYILSWLDDCRVSMWLAEGRLDAAIQWVEVSGLTADDRLSYLRDLNHISLARVLVARVTETQARADYEEALHLLDRLRATADAAGWVQHTLRALVLRSAACARFLDDAGALDAITQALNLAEPGGYLRIFLDEGNAMRRPLQLALANPRVEPYARRLLLLLDAGAASAPESPARTADLPEPLSERELEVLRLLASNMSGPDIARELYISVSTFRSHTKSIYSKLDVHGRREAVSKAGSLGLF